MNTSVLNGSAKANCSPLIKQLRQHNFLSQSYIVFNEKKENPDSIDDR